MSWNRRWFDHPLLQILATAGASYVIGRLLMSQFMPDKVEQTKADAHKQRLVARWKQSAKNTAAAAAANAAAGAGGKDRKSAGGGIGKTAESATVADDSDDDSTGGGDADSKMDAILSANPYETRILSHVVLPEEIDVSMADVGGLDDVKREVDGIFLVDIPVAYTASRLLTPPKGVLFYGPPGTGKTMVAKAIAKECKATFINMPFSAMQDKYYGESHKLVHALFSIARKLAPSIIFIDEIDALLRARGRGGGGGGGTDEYHSSVKAEFMSCWDGLLGATNSKVIVLAATNRPNDIDEAILRRLPRQFVFPMPDSDARVAILTRILKNESLATDIDLAVIAAATDGYSGSDLFELCKTAAGLSLRDVTAYQPSTMAVVVGAAKPATAASSDAKQSTAAASATAPADTAVDVKSAAAAAAAATPRVVSSAAPKVRQLTQANLLEAIDRMPPSSTVARAYDARELNARMSAAFGGASMFGASNSSRSGAGSSSSGGGSRSRPGTASDSKRADAAKPKPPSTGASAAAGKKAADSASASSADSAD